jgi:hypothetical protein
MQENGVMDEETGKLLRSLNMKEFHSIWEDSKDGKALEGDEKVIAHLMKQHPEFHQEFEMADVYADIDLQYDPDKEVNPFLHIAIHAIVENQLAANDPPGVAEFFKRRKYKKETRHETSHMVGLFIMEQIFEIFKNGVPFDLDRYKRDLEKYAVYNIKRFYDERMGE